MAALALTRASSSVLSESACPLRRQSSHIVTASLVGSHCATEGRGVWPKAPAAAATENARAPIRVGKWRIDDIGTAPLPWFQAAFRWARNSPIRSMARKMFSVELAYDSL